MSEYTRVEWTRNAHGRATDLLGTLVDYCERPGLGTATDLAPMLQTALAALHGCEIAKRGRLEDPDPRVLAVLREAIDVAVLVIVRTEAKTETNAQSELGGLRAAFASASR